MKLNQDESLDLARLCCRALEEKKAGELRVIDVSALSSITNYIVIATATSEPHVRALRVELEKALDASKTHIVGVDDRERKRLGRDGRVRRDGAHLHSRNPRPL